MAMNVFTNVKVFSEDVEIHTNKNWNKFSQKSIVNERFKYPIEWLNSGLNSDTFMNYSNKTIFYQFPWDRSSYHKTLFANIPLMRY